MYIFKINGTVVTDPLEWADFTETLEYDKQVSGILMKYNQKFTFVKDGYEYISNYLANNGYCNRLPITVLFKCTDGTDEIVLDGFIFLSEAKFNRSKCTVEVEFEDNSFTSKIYANRGIKTFINANTSKNGTTITPATKINIHMFDPFGAVPNFYREGYDLKDVFRYLIDFMTDGTVGFVSDWYDNLPLNERILVTTGSLLRQTSTNTQHDPPNISFQETFEEIKKKFNIAFAVEKDTSGNPQIRIENFDYFKNDVNQSAIVNDIPELIESFDSDMFYAQVNIGSNAIPLANISDINLRFALWPYQFVTFQKEEYFVQGECNTDEELNLVSDWVIDSNIIQGLILTDTANTDYDRDTVLIQYDTSLTPKLAMPSNNIDYGVNGIYPNRLYYNEILTNAFVADRFNLQGNLAKNLGIVGNTFQAQKTIAEASVTYSNPATTFNDQYIDLAYQDDSTPPNYDPANYYNTTTYRFTAPTTGLYSFQANTEIDITNNTQSKVSAFGCSWNYWYLSAVRLYIRKYNSLGVYQSYAVLTTQLSGGTSKPFGVYNYSGINSFYLQAGDQVSVYMQVVGDYHADGSCPLYNNTITYNVQNGYFKLISAKTGGGIYGKGKDPDNYYTSIYEFEQVLSEAEWSAIKSNPQNYIRFSMDSTLGHKGWLRKIERNKATGLTKFTLTSKFNNQ